MHGKSHYNGHVLHVPNDILMMPTRDQNITLRKINMHFIDEEQK